MLAAKRSKPRTGHQQQQAPVLICKGVWGHLTPTMMKAWWVGLTRTVYIYTVYDLIFGDFPAKIPYKHRICMVLANPTDRLVLVQEVIRMTLWKLSPPLCVTRVGQYHIYTVYIRYFWQGKHQIYGHIRCMYTVLANPMYNPSMFPYMKVSSTQHPAPTTNQATEAATCRWACPGAWAARMGEP